MSEWGRRLNEVRQAEHDRATPLRPRRKQTPKNPEFHDLLLFDIAKYLRDQGVPAPEAKKRSAELMESIEREASKFAQGPTTS